MRASFCYSPGAAYTIGKQVYGSDELKIKAFMSACSVHLEKLYGEERKSRMLSFFYSYQYNHFSLKVEGFSTGGFDPQPVIEDDKGAFMSALAVAFEEGDISVPAWSVSHPSERTFLVELTFDCSAKMYPWVKNKPSRLLTGGVTTTTNAFSDWDLDDFAQLLNQQAAGVATTLIRTLEAAWRQQGQPSIEANFYEGGVRLDGLVYAYSEEVTV